MKIRRVDKILAGTIVALSCFGFLAFASASMGLQSRVESNYIFVLVKQAVILCAGAGLCFWFAKRVNYKLWQKYAFMLFGLSVLLTLLVFVPGVGFSAGGATRWINLDFLHLGTVQPSEFLKFGVILALAAWYSMKKNAAESFLSGLLPFLVVLGISGTIMLKQPDTGTFIVMFIAALAVFVTAGAKWSHLFILLLLMLLGIGILAETRPYVKERLETFMNPERDALGSSYQLRQSLIAIGSGQLKGRGFGQSVQKFSYLPEPMGDSIFAVMSEDFGFFGGLVLLILYTAFAMRGLRISEHSTDNFGKLLGVGIVILVVSQSLINIGSMTGIIPLTGVPLVFVSHGGTALLVAFAEAGILLSISKHSLLA